MDYGLRAMDTWELKIIVILIGLVVWTIAGLQLVIMYVLEAILWLGGAKSKM
jgi:hypothetical protein